MSMVLYRVTAVVGRDTITVEDGIVRASRATLRRLVENDLDPLPGPADGDPADAIATRLRGRFGSTATVTVESADVAAPVDGVVF